MSTTFFKIIFVITLTIGLVGQSNANFIVGENYSDNNNVKWEYVGSYDMFTGPDWKGNDGNRDTADDNATPYNGLEAAVASGVISSPLKDIAIAAFETTFNLSSISIGDEVVNHLSWYDGSETSISRFGEGITADGDGNDKYTNETFANGERDFSAWVNDRVYAKNTYVNYVFKKVFIRVSVSEPYTLAIFVLALCGLGARQIKL